MNSWLHTFADQSANPTTFYCSILTIYATAFVLLAAVVLKFRQHGKHPQSLALEKAHPFSTVQMTIAVAVLFPFWMQSWGQLSLTHPFQILFFGIGVFLLLASLLWHLWAKVDIGLLWSDGIEIKTEHPIRTARAYALARHPMYASLLLWCWGASLMMMNAATLLLTAAVLLPLMIFRARAEERMLTQANPDYRFYQSNVPMLTPLLLGKAGVAARVAALFVFAYAIVQGITGPVLFLLVFLHLYLSFCLTPPKVAFSYRSKSGMMVVFWFISLAWPPFYYLFYVMLLMLAYGMAFDCPCMLLYEKYHGCPCFAVVKKALSKKN